VAANLKLENISRDPLQFAFPNEDFFLRQQDQEHFWCFTAPVFTYDFDFAEARKRASIHPEVAILTAPDFRTLGCQPFQFRGGVAGHTAVVVDSKFLDIMWEFATYEGVGPGVFGMTPTQAIDLIVNAHNAVLYQTGNTNFTREGLDPARLTRASMAFLSYVGWMSYHEFGHFYLWHTLDRLRADAGAPGADMVLQTTKERRRG
jgi:hypothetical protein